ncbi:unnamed protein product, partial [Discosporangium mesarthrocarpum]
HRGLTVENLLVGDDGFTKLADFGSCRTDHRSYLGRQDVEAASEEIKRNTSHAYRAPEQVWFCGACVWV